VGRTFDPSEKANSKIQDYGIIGDSRTAALVSRAGSVDWLCWPRFDSPSLFASLLDARMGGRWQIAPNQPYCVDRCYVGLSNVLQTKFRGSSGEAVLTDLMPVASEEFKRQDLLPEHEVLRQLECVSGEIPVRVLFHPRADYGRRPVTLRKVPHCGIRLDVGRGVCWLRSSVPMEVRQNQAEANICLKAGDQIQFSLSYAKESPSVLPALGLRVHETIERSVGWWQDWAGRCSYKGPYREAVVRSALALKLLTYAPSGAIVAAPTTSLPERPGSGLNWDYRYCWLRDASFTVRALLGLGYEGEANAFLEWMLHTTRITQPELHILYTVYGDSAPAERCLTYLSGYCNSQPVRIGNDAQNQLQLDVYGEVLDAVAQFAHRGQRFDRTSGNVLIGLGKYAAQHWSQPDNGIWEPRGDRQHHTHSRLLCWTGLDRLITLARQGVLPNARVDLLRRERDSIRQDIERRAWNERMQSYVSVLDADTLDASLLLLTWYGFEKPDSPRMQSTYRALCRHLRAGDRLIYRYRTEPPEGAFGICSFWEAEFLALGGGTLEQARELFDHLLDYRNDLGLMAEEIDPDTGAALGNFPQAFTHVGLIGAALSLEGRKQGIKQLAHREEGATREKGR
jgi:GH15 family glucan-1,4-alpha-glucosidase